jgi:hypothetical protein
MRKTFLLWPACLLLFLAAAADTGTVLILHTNDIHDHLRADYDGSGGLPYVAGYVRSVRAERDDVILLDAGDLMEKGDMLAHVTGGRATFEAMQRVGYDAVVPGNHDVRDLDALRRLAKESGLPLVCANLLGRDGAPMFPPSRVLDVGGVKVGVIALTRFAKRAEVLDEAGSTQILAAEAARLREEAHVLVAVVHEGAGVCMELSRAVPEIDVFVSGHTHQLMRAPSRVAETGAIIVQTGAWAEYVGRVELAVDLETKTVDVVDAGVVAMDHATVPADEAMLAWLEEEERAHAPRAADRIGRSGKTLGHGEVSWLVAEALRVRGGGDIGLCMADKVIRGGLPEGELDGNAVFRVVAPWSLETVAVECAGSVLIRYLETHAMTMARPAWAGFAAGFERDEDRRVRVARTGLEPDRVYRIILSKEEWDDRLSEVCGGPAEPLDLDAFEALCAYLGEDAGADVAERAAALAEAASTPGATWAETPAAATP